MVKLANIKVSAKNPVAEREHQYEELSCPASVSADGEFCAVLPDEMASLAQGLALPQGVGWDTSKGKTRLRSKTMDALKMALQNVLIAWLAPNITVERVIRYNVASHVSFFESPSGSIFPNGSFREAKYDGGGRWNDGKMYGNHTANTPSRDGYSLTIGARAYDKRTITRGDAVKIEYDILHPATDENCPLYLLNSWCSFTLPERGVKEMPYTPEAALFFHRMMLGMADLSRRIQTFMHDDSRLMAAIASGQMLLTAPQLEAA